MKHLGWLGLGAIAITALAAGVLLGIVLRFPTGWVLPADNASVISAAFSSIFAVGGAVLLWYLQQTKEAARVAQSIKSYTYKMSIHMAALSVTLDLKDRRRALNLTLSTMGEIDNALEGIKRIEPQLTRLSVEGVQQAYQLEDTLHKVKEKLVDEFSVALGKPVAPTDEEFAALKVRTLELHNKVRDVLREIA
jgi:hypothetical protein